MFKNSLLVFVSVTLFYSLNVNADDELLVVGKTVQVSKQQFLSALKRMDEKAQQQFLNKESRVFKAVKNYYLTQVAIEKSKQSGLYQSAKMQAQIEKAVGDTVLREMYQEYLKKALADKNFEALAKDTYIANKEQYKKPAEVSASHILIDYKSRSKEEALSLTEEIRQEVISGKNFEQLAIQYSNDPSVKQNKGMLGFFTKEKMVASFSEAAFALDKPGDISQAVESEYGYHLIRLNEKRGGEVLPFEQVKENIIKDLMQKEEKKLRQIFRAELLDTKHTKLNKQAIQSLVTK